MSAMNSLSHKETALAHVEAVVQTAQHINDLHNSRDSFDHRADIARGYDAIRQGLKIAEVHALLAVADAIEKSNPQVGVTMQANGYTGPLSCTCGSPGTTSLTPGEVVVHQQDKPCFVQSGVTM